MIESFREMIYPLGFIAQLLFGWRLLSQWVASEIEQNSVTPPNFWRVSLAGNILLMVHSLIQVQFHVCVTQACNAVIAWRNLNLMGSSKERVRFFTVLLIQMLAIGAVVISFIAQDYFLTDHPMSWFRVPVVAFWNMQAAPVGYFWHAAGTIGLVLSSSRFWVQWWTSEREKVSHLGAAFWWCSLIGTLLTLVYFMRIGDPVNFVGPILGMVPYVRNLILINKSRKLVQS